MIPELINLTGISAITTNCGHFIQLQLQFTHPQPREHQLLGRELGPADLVAYDERPDQS